MSTVEAPPALQAMTARLTLPFGRGADVLPLTVAAGGGVGQILVAGYDFAEHEARFGTPPDPAYVLTATGDIAAGTALTATFADPSFGGGTAVVPVPVPDGTAAGDAFAVALPAGASGSTRLSSLVETAAGRAPAPGAASRWRVTVLLGTLARVAWVLGVERDRIRAAAARVAAQRSIGSATGASLDLIGSDLAVPRFPPTPYAFDAATVALYHLDDLPGAIPAVADATGRFPGRTAHDGTPGGSGVVLGGPGRYQGGVAFTAAGAVTVPSSTDFDVAGGGDLTVECFVRPAAGTGDGQVLARRTAGGTGWALEVGELGTGVPDTVRATLSDGTNTVTLAWVASLPTASFTHLALVLDGAAGAARLSVGGLPVAEADAEALGALAGPADLEIGPGATGFRGQVDEVRISSVARTDFSPALGEADEQYRRRLALFRRWCLPTPAGLQDLINEVVPEIDGVAEPFVVDDADAPMERGHHLIRVRPTTLAAGATLDRDGRDDTLESDLWSPDVDSFDPVFLGRYENPSIRYAAAAGGVPAPLPPADPHRMQPAVAAALDRLADLLAGAGLAGLLTVLAGYDPAATDSRRTGRAALLGLGAGDPGVLAAAVHRAGFDIVARHADGTVYAACAPGLPALLGPDGVAPEVFTGRRVEVTVGDVVSVTTQLSTATYSAEPLPVDAETRFWVTPGGGAAAAIASPAPTSPTATLQPSAPGPLLVSADVVRAGRTQTLTVPLLVRPAEVPAGTSIAADGTLGAGLAVVGPPEPAFDPVYLLTHDDPRVSYGPSATDHQMQRAVAATLDDLLDDLAADGVAGQLALLAAYDPAGAPLAARGRLLRFSHPALTPGQLAVRAHRAGFGYVANDTTAVVAAAPPGDPVGVTGPDEVDLGARITLVVDPAPATIGPTARLGWATGRLFAGDDSPGVGLTTTTAPSVDVIGTAPGISWVQATLRSAGDAGPFAVTVRLRPELSGARVPLDDYYLVMNVINALHPIGVEVLTESLRSAVVELGGSITGLDPSFTYPAFRLHRASAGQRQGANHG